MLQNVRLQKQGKNSKLKKMMKPRLREIEDGRVKILAESSFTNGVWRMPGIEDWNSVMKRDCGADCRIKKSSGCRVVSSIHKLSLFIPNSVRDCCYL